jgi:hypothetical protein
MYSQNLETNLIDFLEFLEKNQDGGDISENCENWFLLSYFQNFVFFKNFFYVSFGLQLRTSHGRMFFEIIQNGGVNKMKGYCI